MILLNRKLSKNAFCVKAFASARDLSPRSVELRCVVTQWFSVMLRVASHLKNVQLNVDTAGSSYSMFCMFELLCYTEISVL